MEKKNNKIDIYTKVCVMRGFYDEAGEYREEYRENVNLCELPKSAINRINLDYDVNTLYSKNDVLVIAKSLQDIAEYKRLGASPHFFHGLLCIAERDWYNGYMCILSDLKVLKRIQNRKKKCNNNYDK